MKKIICVILSVIMLLSVCACSKGGDEETTQAQENEEQDDSFEETKPSSNAKANFTLPYSESDSLNPYLSKTQINRALTSLLYDSLFALDESFKAVPVIAQSIEISGVNVVVTLNENAVFSDSTSLNATDVVYSFNTAKDSDRYSEPLGNVLSATATEKYKVRFTLEKSDSFVSSILTFPIIEYGSAGDNVPLGSGRYYFSSKKLSYNKNHISGVKPSIKSVYLFPLSEGTNFVDALQIGNISMIFRDLSDCDIKRAAAQNVAVTLNNIVYLGVNSKNAVLKDSAVRRAINLSIDKDSIVSADYQGYAVRTESPFNPLWSESSKSESVFDQSVAVEILEENGYTYASGTDKYRSDKKGKSIELKILVSGDNEFRREAAQSIAKNLTQIGIGAEVVPVGFKKFKERVKEGKYDLYLGEVKLCENMSLSPFFEKSGKARYGIELKSDIVSSYEKLLSGKITVPEFEKEFSAAPAFIPVCFRQGVVIASNTISDNIISTPTDIFSNISEWKMN